MKTFELKTNNDVWRQVCKVEWNENNLFELPKWPFIEPIAKVIYATLTSDELIRINFDSVVASLSIVYDTPEGANGKYSRYKAENTNANGGKGAYLLYEMWADCLIVSVLDTDIMMKGV